MMNSIIYRRWRRSKEDDERMMKEEKDPTAEKA